jgi:cyclic beta-1,2-glucan synthetase
LIGRRIWYFFTTFVTAKEHYLPPDNFQEDPQPVIAHRSSPTNFGLYLLSVVAARDFGWLGLIDTVERLEATLGTLNALPRLHGHFYNWYDTRDLHLLEPINCGQWQSSRAFAYIGSDLPRNAAKTACTF